jgi:hypothetical protein
MQWNTKVALGIAGCAIVDTVIPIPLTAVFLIYVFLARPPFFKAWVDRVYSGSGAS